MGVSPVELMIGQGVTGFLESGVTLDPNTPSGCAADVETVDDLDAEERQLPRKVRQCKTIRGGAAEILCAADILDHLRAQKCHGAAAGQAQQSVRSEEHTSEL